jgi:hypothetical protein
MHRALRGTTLSSRGNSTNRHGTERIGPGFSVYGDALITHQNSIFIDPENCGSSVGYYITTSEYKPKDKPEEYSLSSTVVLTDCSHKIDWGFGKVTLAQNPWLSEFCTQHPDHTVYLEVVPTQKGYTYGCTGDETKVFVFDVLRPDGTWVDKRDLYGLDPLGLGQHLVPLLNGHCKTFNLDETKALVEGPSTVPGAKHIREGIVIASATERTVRGLGRAQLKIKSMEFMEKENK